MVAQLRARLTGLGLLSAHLSLMLRPNWTRVRVSFAIDQSTDHALSIVINPGVSVTGKLVLSIPKGKEDTEQSAAEGDPLQRTPLMSSTWGACALPHLQFENTAPHQKSRYGTS